MKSRGFTLIELLVTISIIGLLSSIVLVALQGARTKGVIGSATLFEDQLYHAFGANAVAIYGFDNGSGLTATDGSSNNNNLTLTSSSMWAQASKDFRGASALYLDGTNYAYRIGLRNFNLTAGSISAWIYPTATLNQAPIFCDDDVIPGGGGQYASDLFCFYIGQGYLMLYNDTTYSYVTSGVNIPTNSWSNIAISWTPTSVRFYLNGKQVGTDQPYSSTGLTPLYGNGPYNFSINDHQDIITPPMIGYLDELRVYSQSLQLGYIEKIYAEGLPRNLAVDIK